MHGGINMNTRQQTVAKNRMPQQVGGQPIQNGIIEENSLPRNPKPGAIVGSSDGGVNNANNWLSNILPSASSSTSVSPSNSTNMTQSISENAPPTSTSSKFSPKEEAGSAQHSQVQNLKREGEGSGGAGDSISTMLNSPQKPVNLLPEVPSTTSRKLTDREQRDCEVIGAFINTFQYFC